MSEACPRCARPVLEQLARGQVCADCASDDAWARSDRLVVTRAEVAEAALRRARGAGALERPSRRLGRLLPTGVALALSASALAAALALVTPWPVGPLDRLLAGLATASQLALALGLGGAVLALVAHLRLRRTRLFRSVPALLATLGAFAGGLSSALVGFLGLRSEDLGLDHLTVPDRGALTAFDPLAAAIAEATVVIVAPDADGDAAFPALGSGAVVARDADRAWVLTCSHVAMPYAAVAAWRDAGAAHPVWIGLADGRGALGRVRWTARPPLDVALVEVPLTGAPRPVAIAAESTAATPDAAVAFVPNPLRKGWLVHRGHITKRVTHKSPAGDYSLVYTDLPVEHGDSGSGLFDAAGRLVGVNTWKRVGLEGPQGISLPSEALRAIVEGLERGDLDRLSPVEAP